MPLLSNTRLPLLFARDMNRFMRDLPLLLEPELLLEKVESVEQVRRGREASSAVLPNFCCEDEEDEEDICVAEDKATS